MKRSIQCSNCGEIWVAKGKTMGSLFENVVNAGWGSCGNALYCPACAASWKERNGDRPMNGVLANYRAILDVISAPKGGKEA